MSAKRYWGVLFTALIIVIFSASFRTSVQADDLLQDAPRLDGMKIYFTEANGEASRFDRSEDGLSRFAGLISQLGANLFTLEWRTGFPTDADLIVIAGPRSDFAPDQIARLWSYMNNNGRLLLLANANTAARGGSLPSTSGLFSLTWTDMGFRAQDDVVVTEGTVPLYSTPEPEATELAEATAEATVSPEVTIEAVVEATPFVPQVIGDMPILTSDFGASSYSSNQPITEGLEGDLQFFGARSLEVDASIQGFVVEPLVFSPDNFYGETAFAAYLNDGTINFDIGKDITRGALPLAAAYSNETTQSRIVVIGDREVATNGGGLRTSPSNSGGFVFPTNPRFMLNAVTWLLDSKPVLMEFPTPAPTATVTITPSPTPTRTPTALPTAEGEVTAEAPVAS